MRYPFPLRYGDQVIGTLDFYAGTPDIFSAQQIESAEKFLIRLCLRMQAILMLTAAQRLAADLSASLSERVTTEQATGVGMSRAGGSAEEAFSYLRASSRSGDQPIGAFAASTVEDAVRRAKRRTSGAPEARS